MEQENKIMAVCGLKCSECDIFKATDNPEIAQQIADLFKKERNEEVKIEDIRCLGCKGDRKKHWSADCWILERCVDNKGLDFCSECNDFPCDRLSERAKGNKRYNEAINRLIKMKIT